MTKFERVEQIVKAEYQRFRNLPPEDDLKYWHSDSTWRAVYCLIETPSFNPSLRWISNRLKISIEEAFNAIESLEKLGVIIPAGRTFRTSKNLNSLALQDANPLYSHTILSMQVTTKMTESDIFHNHFCVGDKMLLKKYEVRFNKLIEELSTEAKQSGCTDVIAISLTGVQITEQENQLPTKSVLRELSN